MFNPKIGDWVQFKGKFARVHGATKGGRFLVEVQANDTEVFREWVRPLSITPLDPAVGSILESIYEVV
mgnify:FL=1